MTERVLAPPGRRLCDVVERRETGGYVVFSALDADGPEPAPGQFYMLAAERGWGGEGGRPYLSRAFSVAGAQAGGAGVRLDFLAESVGPGTDRLTRLADGEGLWVVGPLGRPFSAPSELAPQAHGAILVGGGIGIAPLAILRRRLAGGGVPTRTLLGFRDEAHSGGLELFASERGAPSRSSAVGRSVKPNLCSEIRLASEDGHAGHKGYVTDLLAVLLEGDDAEGAVVYACGPPAMLETVREMCVARRVRAELAMEAPMACGFGACFGCAVPLTGGGFMRLCVDGPVVAADEVSTALVAGSGH
jgi:dihydroorotate dehydrogenase electron transfer subunit